MEGAFLGDQRGSQRPRSAGSARRGQGGRESVGNPLNLTLRASASSLLVDRDSRFGALKPLSHSQSLNSFGKTRGSDAGEATAMLETTGFGAAASSSAAPAMPEKLRFNAYFVEPILEYTQKSVPYQKERIRKCVITYFPRDKTVGIDEPRLNNSGYMQGKMLKRSLVKKRDGTKLDVTDFRIGSEVEILGKKFVVVDAETRTRKWFEYDFGEALGCALEYPDDGFEASRARATIKYKQAAQDTSAKKSRPSSAPSMRRSTSKNTLLSKSQSGLLVEAGHEVLRFFCAYQDDRTDGDRRKYTLHYFLHDDTLEIKEVATEGVERFPNLLRRSRLPKDLTSNPHNPLTDAKRVDYVSWRDLACGSTVSVWGRELLVLSCDRSTEAWFAARGIVQHPLQVAPEESDAFPEALPPFNGFGAENDLYAMGLSLQPGVIRSSQEDYQRFILADNKVLRYECKLVGTATGIDREKIFVVNYNLGDDTISVFEPPIRNSGCSGGVFLQRTRYKKHIPDHRKHDDAQLMAKNKGMGSVLSRWLRPADFYAGAEVAFEEPTTGRLLQTFKVLRADGYTERVNSEKQLCSASRMAQILEQLAERLCAARVQCRQFLANLEEPDVAARGLPRRTLSESVFRDAIKTMEREANSVAASAVLGLDDSTLDEICWTFADKEAASSSSSSSSSPPRVWYDEFVDALVTMAPMPRVPERQASSTTTVSHKSFEKCILQALRHPMNRGNSDLRASFRAEDKDGTGTVDSEAWYRVLRKHRIHGVLSRDEAQALKERYTEPSALSARIEYERLCDKAFEGNFDDYMAALLMVLPERGDLTGVDVTQYRDHLRKGGNQAPTIRTYLDRVNGAARDCNGDVQRKLGNCMRAFSSAFGRNNRKKMLRKHLMAFDTHNTGTCTRDEFTECVQRIIAENYCELDARELSLLLSYVFPQAWTRQPFDALLGILVARDVKGVMRIHNAAMNQREDPRFLFR